MVTLFTSANVSAHYAGFWSVRGTEDTPLMDQWQCQGSELQRDDGAVHHKDSQEPPVHSEGRNCCVIQHQQPRRSLWGYTLQLQDWCLFSQQFSKSIWVCPSATGLPCDLTITSEVTLSLFFRDEILSNFRGHLRFRINYRQRTPMSSVGDIVHYSTRSPLNNNVLVCFVFIVGSYSGKKWITSYVKWLILNFKSCSGFTLAF